MSHQSQCFQNNRQGQYTIQVSWESNIICEKVNETKGMIIKISRRNLMPKSAFLSDHVGWKRSPDRLDDRRSLPLWMPQGGGLVKQHEDRKVLLLWVACLPGKGHPIRQK